MSDKTIVNIEYKKRLDWMDRKLKREVEKKLKLPPASSKIGKFLNSLEVWMATPLGRYCPNTGNHLTASENYKITRYEDGTSRIEVVLHSA